MEQNTLIVIAVIVLLLPLLSFSINIFFGKKLGKISGIIGTSILSIDLLLSIYILYSKLVDYSKVAIIQTNIDWIHIGSANIKVGIGIDNLAAFMLIVVTLISTLVHLYSTEYMADDKKYSRYYAYLGLFTFSMLGIVIANNFLFMYIFWELVGISSYLLIGFWYEKDSAANAGKKAFIVNRIGDLGFFIGIMIIFYTYGSFMFEDIFSGIQYNILPFDSGTMLTVAGILLFCGAIGKSAQFPLHVWLPDAMEGPTPVSALIHAATMVAAGVYMVARIFPMLTGDALTFITIIGCITAFISATIAITQVDFKKVLAYSTVSQLGFMIMSLGVGAWTSGFFHLVTHAWFKAALFLASGSVIHAMHHAMHHINDHTSDAQDIRNMGGLRKTMPLTYITFLFVTLAISGVPLTSGFLSKDGILAGTLAYGQINGGIYWLVPILGFLSAGMTAFYMFRLLILAFHGKPTEISIHTKENKLPIVLPLIILSVLSFWIFYSSNPLNASEGWFSKALPAPKTVVPDQFQRPELVWHPVEERLTKEEIELVKRKNLKVRIDVLEKLNSKILAEKAKYRNDYEEEMHHFHIPAMLMSILIAGMGIGFAFLIYQMQIFNADNMMNQFKPLYNLSFRKWYFDEIYQATFVAGTVGLGKIMGYFDLKIIDGIVNLTAFIWRNISYFIGHFDNIVIDGFINLTANIISLLGAMFRKIQTGSVQTYLILTVISIMVLVYFIW